MDETRRIDRFAERLDALGPDLARWPADEADEAHDLISRSGEARRLHEDARRLADLVARAAEADAPNGFVFRVVAEVNARRTDRLGWLLDSPRRFTLAGASFCVVALALGVTLGAVTVPAQADDIDADLGSPLVSLDADL